MTRDEVAIVREIYRAFAEHRFPHEYLAENFIWETSPQLPDAGTYRGRDAVRVYFRDWVAGWDDVQPQVEQFIDRADHIVAVIRGRYWLSEATEPLEARYAHVWTVRDGKAVHARATSEEELGLDIADA